MSEGSLLNWLRGRRGDRARRASRGRVLVRLYERPFTEAELRQQIDRGARDGEEWYRAIVQLIGEMTEERLELLANPGLVDPEENRHHTAGAIHALLDLAEYLQTREVVLNDAES